jgi:hypothetical protein
MCESEGLKEKEIEMLSFKFRGHVYSIKVRSFNGMIQLGFDGWLLNNFRCKQQLISHIEEQARWAEGAIKTKKLPKKILGKIEEFLAADESVWQGNCE